jgi:hypothetical protein
VEPADVVAADVLAAVAGALGRYKHGRAAGRLDHQLLPAAALERDEPEGGGVDAMAAGRQQAVVAVDGGLHALEGGGDPLAGVAFRG